MQLILYCIYLWWSASHLAGLVLGFFGLWLGCVVALLPLLLCGPLRHTPLLMLMLLRLLLLLTLLHLLLVLELLIRHLQTPPFAAIRACMQRLALLPLAAGRCWCLLFSSGTCAKHLHNNRQRMCRSARTYTILAVCSSS